MIAAMLVLGLAVLVLSAFTVVALLVWIMLDMDDVLAYRRSMSEGEN